MRCPSCNTEASVLLIDCQLPFGKLRDETRYCYGCRPVARHEFANCLPRVIMASSNLSAEEKKAALAARRYAPDHRGTYPIEERLFDLTAGPREGPGGIRTLA